MSRLKKIKTSLPGMIAEQVQGVLRDNAVESILQNNLVGRLVTATSSWADLYAHEKDYENALKLVDKYFPDL